VNSPGNKIIYWNYEGDFNQDVEDLEVNVFAFLEAEPEAKFTLNPASGDFYAPFEVEFTNLSENSDRFEWNFGDPGSGNENTSARKNPTHTYQNSGRYVVTLIAHNERMEQGHTFRDTLFVEEKPMGGVKLAVIGGLNFSDMLIDEGELNPETQMLTGFHVGPAAEFPITEWVSFETGLLLSTKGAVYKTALVGVNKSEFNLLYLDIPLTAKATYDFGGAAVYGTVGPYVGVGLSGKMKSQIVGSAELIDNEKDVTWDSDLKRLDYGLTIGAGMEVNAIRIGISYELGLANISAFPQMEDHFIYHRVLRISAGYSIAGN
jgi:PKD repeat protein